MEQVGVRTGRAEPLVVIVANAGTGYHSDRVWQGCPMIAAVQDRHAALDALTPAEQHGLAVVRSSWRP